MTEEKLTWAVMQECREGDYWLDVTYELAIDSVQEAFQSAWDYAKAQRKNKAISRVWIAPTNRRFETRYKFRPAYCMPF